MDTWDSKQFSLCKLSTEIQSEIVPSLLDPNNRIVNYISIWISQEEQVDRKCTDNAVTGY